jgi:hypothetical protein
MKKVCYFIYLIFLSGILCLLCHNTAEAQVSFGYDAAGNRVNRVIDMQFRSQKAEEKVEEKVEQKTHSEILKDFSIKIYPNPTKGDLTVEIMNLPEGKTANLRLYDMSGNLVLQKTNITDTEYLNISNRPNGIYLMRIAAGDSSTEWKIIKQ